MAEELTSTSPASKEHLSIESGEMLGLDEIEEIEARTYRVMEQLRDVVFAPDRTKRLERRFKIAEAAAMVGRTTQAIRSAEEDGRLPPPVIGAKNRREPYTLEAINKMRELFDTLPWRQDDEEAVVLPIQNFKGGVGKSTTGCHLAQYLALKGYRVCIIDCDPQATTTTMFGINPDYDIDEDNTLLPYLMHAGESTLEYALRDTHWPGIKLIPANLDLYNVEYILAAKVHNDSNVINRLRDGIDSIKHQFDVILIDPPPALGMISLSVLRAANALVVPIPPATPDFSSSAHFFSMLKENLAVLEERGMRAEFKFLKILITKMVERKVVQKEISETMLDALGNRVISKFLKDSAAIDNASASLLTVYELTTDHLKKHGEDPPIVSRDAYQRCMAYLNGVNEEIELLIRKTWPSHRHALRKEGLV